MASPAYFFRRNDAFPKPFQAPEIVVGSHRAVCLVAQIPLDSAAMIHSPQGPRFELHTRCAKKAFRFPISERQWDVIAALVQLANQS
jgi:hypothetical protein